MNKKLVLALLLAVASGSSVVAMDSVKDAAKAFGSGVVNAAEKVESVVTWPVAQLLNLKNAPVLHYVLNETTANARNNVTRHSPRVARLALTAALVYFGRQNENVKSFLKKVTDPITSRCCKDKK
ncbi:MAG: hypothetical protein ACD_64C00258G0004 [uncultured bacterium]|nr:MAG: hypothetical protein ACD_64C00258G0004 [uncultured bacterium]